MAYDPYESSESRSTFGLIALVAIVAVCGILLFFLAKFFTSSDQVADDGGEAVEESEEVVRVPGKLSDPPDPAATVPESPSEILESLGIGISAADPALLVQQIGRNLEAGEVRAAANIIGRKALTEAQLERLHKLAGDARLKLNMDRPISEIGEIEINNHHPRPARPALLPGGVQSSSPDQRYHGTIERDVSFRFERSIV